MPTTQFIPSSDSNGTSNLSHLLSEKDNQVMSLIQPRDVAKVFGPGESVDIPEKGYTDPEWYFKSSDGCVWGIGWRYGRTRLRGKGASMRSRHFFEHPSKDQAAEFVEYIVSELEKWGA